MSDTATMSKETHDALLQKAVADATATTEKALAAKTDEAKSLKGRVEELETEIADLKDDNARLNKDLDTAQVSLKSAQDEVANLKNEIAQKDESARKAEVASKRADQVKNLGLFDEKYVSEKASSWADIADEDWAARIDEWKQLKPAKSETPKSDAASAMSGTSEALTKEAPADEASKTTKPKPRRAVLGLS